MISTASDTVTATIGAGGTNPAGYAQVTTGSSGGSDITFSALGHRCGSGMLGDAPMNRPTATERGGPCVEWPGRRHPFGGVQAIARG